MTDIWSGIGSAPPCAPVAARGAEPGFPPQFPLAVYAAANVALLLIGSIVANLIATTGAAILFIGATKDEKIRAFDRETGQVLWEYTLPAGGYATPATYELDGRQYVVIPTAGGKMGTKKGDAYVAFALPEE